MADLSMDMLPAAENINESDLSLLFQSGVTKKVTGTVLIGWLTQMADGHGGIQSIVTKGTSGLVDTYRITLADATFFDFTVTNGKSITNIDKTKTVGLVDTHTITYNDGTTSTFTVTNGAKGDKGDTPHIWIRYASQKPTDSSPSFGLLPDDWMGQCVNYDATAPTDWEEYEWFKIKGEKGDIGNPSTLVSQSVQYQTSSSGTIIPSGNWQESIPVVAQGNYLWTRVTLTYNTGSPVVSYSVSRMGLDGSGSVSSVAGISPGPDGDVALTAENIGALPTTGGTMTGGIDMNGQTLEGLNAPTSNNQAATKEYADKMLPKTGGAMTGQIAMGSNKITGMADPSDNSDATTKGYVDSRCLTFLNTSVAVSAWVTDTNTDHAPLGFTQRAAVALAGVTAAMVPDVYFSAADAVSGNFSPVAQSYAGGVYLYAASKPTAALTIPTIRVTK